MPRAVRSLLPKRLHAVCAVRQPARDPSWPGFAPGDRLVDPATSRRTVGFFYEADDDERREPAKHRASHPRFVSFADHAHQTGLQLLLDHLRHANGAVEVS